jgi:hypothetical protein
MFGNGKVENIEIDDKIQDFNEIEKYLNEAIKDAKKQMKLPELKKKLTIEAENKMIASYNEHKEEELAKYVEMSRRLRQKFDL